jgi:hypothetical protein
MSSLEQDARKKDKPNMKIIKYRMFYAVYMVYAAGFINAA